MDPSAGAGVDAVDRPRIGISACILGEPVRYNGGHCRDGVIIPELAPHVEFVSVCPEVEAGLGAPRESLRLVGPPAQPSLVAGRTGRDETERLRVWSQRRVDALARMDLDGFILKKGSPTCGMAQVRVYRTPDTRPTRDGVGIFARELQRRLPSLALEEEGRLRDAGLREHFVTRVFASRRWRAFVDGEPSPAALAAFHARHALLLSAHGGVASALDALADAGSAQPFSARLAAYGAAFLTTLASPPTRARQAEVMRLILDGLQAIDPDERADVAATICDYGAGYVPLIVPARVLWHEARREHAPVAQQTWFSPWPEAIHLRLEVTRESLRDHAQR